MTNREWLNSLSDEELAFYMQKHTLCDECPAINECNANCEYTCSHLLLNWLKAERRESEW